MIKKGNLISIVYEVKDNETKEVIDKNDKANPLRFIFGQGEVIKGIENNVLNMSSGEEKEFTVEPKDGYGEYNSDWIENVPIEQFSNIKLKKNMILFGQGEDGNKVQVSVKDFNDKEAKIDYNHPLAGKTLLFKLSMLSIQESYTLPSGGCGCNPKSSIDEGCCKNQ